MDKKIETIIKKINIDWLDIKNACRQTIRMKDSKIEPTKEWKRKMLICRHSPIRKGIITWRWPNIPFAIMGHFVRHHVGCTPYVSTSREDRTNVKRENRSQMEMVTMEMDANINSLLDMSEKRLCTCADPTTKKYMEDLKYTLEKYDEDVSWAMAPSGIIHGGCTEPFSECKICNNIIKTLNPEDRLDPEKRINAYNEYCKKLRKR